MDVKNYTTQQVAQKAGVHKDTILRWLREGKIQEPHRNRNGWRVFSDSQVSEILNFANGSQGSNNLVNEPAEVYENTNPVSHKMAQLHKVDWDFNNANSSYLTHSIHPYPAKFIPQIPKTLIRELASTGDTILDPFCGSGTTLVESLRLECNAIGIDANPLACLMSRAKTHAINDEEAGFLVSLAKDIESLNENFSTGTLTLFDEELYNYVEKNKFKGVEDWFDQHVIVELSYIKEVCLKIENLRVRDLALTAFSSIIVIVSRQDSDTRYVRREKNTKPGDTFKQFVRALRHTIKKSLEFSEEVITPYKAQVVQSSILQPPEIPPVDLVVCSPPYPNAYSYHLYHRTRMMWLGMDQPTFKQDEIGSHRKYSRKGKNAATVDTFRGELYTILSWLSHTIRNNGYACFVIGDSTLKGERIKNDELLIEVAKGLGYKVEANINRTLQSTRKSFNPKIGKIRDEHIVILKNRLN